MKNIKIYNNSYFTAINEKKSLINFLGYLNNGDSILDLGAGSHPYEKEIISMGIKYISIDFEGKQDYLIDLNIGKLPFSDNSINGIVLFQVLEHIFDINSLFFEINRVLKKDGYLFISTPFIHGIHGIPHDFYRYTNYFYKSIGIKYNFEIISLTSGIYGFGNVLYLFNQILDYFSEFLICKLLVSPIIIINNFFIYLYNFLSYLLPKRLHFALRENIVSDYVVIYKK